MNPADSFSGFEEPPAQQSLPSRVTWGWREMLTASGAVLVAFFLLSLIVVGPVLAEYGEDSVETVGANAIALGLWQVFILGCVFWTVRRTGSDWGDVGFRAPRGRVLTKQDNRWLDLAAVIAVALFAAFAVIHLYGLSVQLTGLEDQLEPSSQIPDATWDSSFVVAMLGLTAVVGAPIAEETLFRGFLFAGIRQKWPLIFPLLLTSLIFAGAHYDKGLVIPFTLIGMILAYTYHRADTLIAPMAVHLLFNLTSFSVLVFFPELRDADETTGALISLLLGG